MVFDAHDRAFALFKGTCGRGIYDNMNLYTLIASLGCAFTLIGAVLLGGSAMARKRIKDPNGVDKYVGSRMRMRRLMLGLSQGKIADAIGLTFQQVQKYEKGTNRMGSSRLQQIANVLQVPVTFFFDGAPGQPKISGKAPSPAFVSDYLATADGLALTRAFMRLPNAKIKRSVVALVEQIADDA